MIYRVLHFIVRFAIKLYFRKIHVVGLENIPKNKAIIFTSNHPTSFIEPCLMACYLPINLNFLVRGDIFAKKWLKWLLIGTHQIPIYRQIDGLDSVKRNLPTQAILEKLFLDKKALLMFPEASTMEHLYIRPLKKGVARFAFLNPEIDVDIVPLGVNYKWSAPFNSEVTINVGKPIHVHDYIGKSYSKEYDRILDIMQDISVGMKACVRDINNYDREEVMYDIIRLEALKNQPPLFPVHDHDPSSFNNQNALVKALDRDDELFEKTKDLIRNYKSVISRKPSLTDKLWMFLLLPIYLITGILHFIPIRLAKYISQNVVKQHEFKTSVFLAVVIFFNIIAGLISVIFSLFFGIKILLGFTIYIALGIFSSFYLKAYQNKWAYLIRNQKQKEIADAFEMEDFNHLVGKGYNKFSQSI